MSGADPAVLATRALAIAIEVCGKDAEVQVDVHRRGSANVRFARNEPTTSGESDEAHVGITVALGKRAASSSSNQADDASLRAVATRALQMAKLAPDDPERMPLLPPQTYGVVPSAYDLPLAEMGPKDRAAIAARAIAKGDEAKVRVAGYFERNATEHVIQSSTGLVARHRATGASYTVTARTEDGTGSGWGGREAHRLVDIEDDVLASRAIDKAVRSAKPRALPPGKYTVVLEPQAVFEMLAFMIGEMQQRAADEGRSFFAGKVGKKLFPDFVNLRSDPAALLTPGAPFDGEGLPLAAHPWISEGKIGKLAVSRFWAQKRGGLEPTGTPAVFALSGGRAETTDDLVRGTKRGLLVTRFWYIRMLEAQTVTLTGLTRDGVFLIEDGKLTSPVVNFRFNESPVTMLKNAEAMTRTTSRVVAGGVWQLPALRTHDFNMASVSAAV